MITDTHIIACPDIEAYNHVSLSLQRSAIAPQSVPVLASKTIRLDGFPVDARLISYEQWRQSKLSSCPADSTKRGRVREQSVDGRVCLTVNDPACVAVSRLLSGVAQRRRTLAVSTSVRDWERAARKLVSDKTVKSLTFVVPSWNLKTRVADPAWIVRVLNLMREMLPVSGYLSWGIITGINETTLSLMAAKALLQAKILAAYSDHPTAVLTTYHREALGAPIPRWRSDGSAQPLQFIDAESIADGTARDIVKRQWNAIIFKCHGRSYCACDGFLCGARRFDEDPVKPPKSCVLKTQCYDPSFPQIDPRRFDTPVMVLDSCGTGNWASPVWETGIPALAFFAAAGAAGVVLTGDGTTLNSPEDYVDVLWALTAADTMGKATALLNEVRRGENVRLPYYLLGDPETLAGTTRWSEWSAAAEAKPMSQKGNALRWTITSRPSDAPFLRVSLPRQTRTGNLTDWTTYVSSRNKGLRVANRRPLESADKTEVWLDVSAMNEYPKRIAVERRRQMTLPSGLVEEAMTLPGRTISWGAPLSRVKPGLIQAAARVIEVNQLVESLAKAVIAADPEEVEGIIGQCSAEWMDAHLACVQAILEYAPKGLWPLQLWSSFKFQAEASGDACPWCGIAPTIRRTYSSSPNFLRHVWECLRCDVIRDEPLLPSYPQLKLQAPRRITYPETVTAQLRLDNREGDIDCLGAGTLLLDRTGHGMRSTPGVFPINLRKGEQFKKDITIVFNGVPPISHLYRVRVMLLLNGHWFWASRPVMVVR